MSADSRHRFPWGLTIVCALAFALLILLGVWQVQRMQWKEGLIAGAEKAATRPPVTVLDPWRSPPSPPERNDRTGPSPAPDLRVSADPRPYPPTVFPEFQKVIVSCDWDERNVVDLHSIHDGQAGFRLITGCDGFLIDLGFVPEGVPTRPVRLVTPIPSILKPRPLLTQARTTPAPNVFAPPPDGNRFYSRDNRAIAKALHMRGPVAKQVLFAEQSAYPWIPELVAEPPPAAFTNNHLGYALTWFGLALAVVGFYIALLRRKPKS